MATKSQPVASKKQTTPQSEDMSHRDQCLKLAEALKLGFTCLHFLTQLAQGKTGEETLTISGRPYRVQAHLRPYKLEIETIDN